MIDGRLVLETGYSFPSGHSTNNVAFYVLAVYLIHKNVKNKKICNTLCMLLAFVPILIAFSRLYLGVHYISDIIAGICLGNICVMITIFIMKNLKLQDNKSTNEK